MKPMTAKPNRLAFLLLFLSAAPILVALVRIVQIPLGTLPEISQHLTDTPVSHWLHVVGGALFGIIGPIQFTGVLKRRYGVWHKRLGYVFVLSGLFLGLSSLTLLVSHLASATFVLHSARAFAGIGMAICLILSVRFAINRNIAAHRAWMIRAYALGMGSATVVFIFIPLTLITGQEIEGYLSDVIFVVSWAVNIGIAEKIIRMGRMGSRSRRRRPLPSPLKA